MADNEVTVRIVTETDTTQVDDLKTSIDEIQSGADSASTSVDQLSDSAANVDGSQISEASASADELGSSADQADTEVQELQNSLGLIEASALLSVADQIGSLGASAESMTQDMNTAAISVGQLATQTGIAEPQMVSLINNISNATFPNDEAMMYVKSLDQIGVSSGNLGQSATDLDKINDAFGLGANKVNSLGQELSVLGVDMNNISSSFNALAYANANTVGGMDNYYNFLRKYDAQFKELGFNVDQASVIIAGATHKFGGGKAALTGLNEALKESNGDTRALEQALGLQAGALDNASQITGQYEGQLQQLANEEAEHKSWLDQLNAAWEDMSLALSPILSPLGSVMGLIGQAGSWAVGVNGLIQLARTTKIATAMQWLWNAALAANPITLIVLAIAALIAILAYLYFNNEQVRDSINALGQAFIQAGQIIYNTIINVVNWVITQLQNLYNYIMTLGGLLPEQANITGNQIIDSILMVLAFIATLPAQIAMYFANVIASTLGFGDNFVQTMIQSASDSVTGFVEWITQLPGKLAEELDQMIQQALDFAANLPGIIAGAAADMVSGWIFGSGESSPGFMYDALIGELMAMVNAPPEMLSGLIDWISQYGYQMAEVLSQALLGISFDTVINNVMWLLNTLNGLWNWIYTAGGLIPETVELTGNSVIDTLIRVISFVATLPIQLGMIFTNAIASTLGFGNNFSQNIINAASQAVNGFINWISQMPQRLGEELDKMIQQALDFASRLPEIIANAAANMVGGWVGGSGESSPGFMYDAFYGELVEMNKIGTAFSNSLPSTMKFAGSEMVRNFNPNLNSSVPDRGSGNTFNITLEIGSVDKRERVNEIIEAIRDYIEWDNTTAGRTV